MSADSSQLADETTAHLRRIVRQSEGSEQKHAQLQAIQTNWEQWLENADPDSVPEACEDFLTRAQALVILPDYCFQPEPEPQKLTMANFGDRYAVHSIPIGDIHPSPENDKIYGEVKWDDSMGALIESIREHELEEPILLSEDLFVISGHRRLFACQELEMEAVPVRFKSGIYHDGHPDWHKLLAEYNPQRVKSVGSLLKEAMMRDSSGDQAFAEIMEERKAQSSQAMPEFMVVTGDKDVKPLTPRTAEFLAAAKKVIRDLGRFWPLNIRQIHYNLLNDPPMKQTLSKPDEKNRYKNDLASYKATTRLLTSARYAGEVEWAAISDETRPCEAFDYGWDNPQAFMDSQVRRFLCGYKRKLQEGQPRHIEFLGEKNTIKNIIAPVCGKFEIPWTLGRGYAGPSVWLNVAGRFKASGKDSMVLVVASDYDPEGLDLANDAVRTLRQKFGVPVEAVRCGVNRDQIEELDLDADFNSAKDTSTRYKGFVETTGGEETWELEALPPEYLQERLREAFESVMDTEIFNAVIDRQQEEREGLADIKRQFMLQLEI